MKITIEEIKNNKVLALSWKEPYGSLMLHGKIETRTWKTNYRGLVLICCGKVRYEYKAVYDISGEIQIRRMQYLFSQDRHRQNGMIGLKLAHAIAIGHLVECRPMKPEDENKTFVKYYPDLFCHVYEDVTPIVPFPWKGKQGWSIVSDEIKNEIILNG